MNNLPEYLQEKKKNVENTQQLMVTYKVRNLGLLEDHWHIFGIDDFHVAFGHNFPSVQSVLRLVHDFASELIIETH